MPRMQRANSVLHVKDNEVQHYLTLGYNLMSDSGKDIVKRAVPKDAAALTAQLLEACQRIEVLERQAKEYTQTIMDLRRELETAKATKPVTKAKKPAAEPAE